VYCLTQLSEADHWNEEHHDTTENLKRTQASALLLLQSYEGISRTSPITWRLLVSLTLRCRVLLEEPTVIQLTKTN
jgi:hypothetical protein